MSLKYEPASEPLPIYVKECYHSIGGEVGDVIHERDRRQPRITADVPSRIHLI